MALWIRNRPPEKCFSAEVEVAEFLVDLPDDWVIRWGFHYRDNAGTLREGDFLILGPQGGLLVLEVKAGNITHNPYTGSWNTADGDNPQFQLDAEWKSVVKTINNQRGPRASLFVGRALGAPGLSLPTDATNHFGIAREFLFDSTDLRNFPQTWSDRMTNWAAALAPRAREIFFECYGQDATPTAVRHFVDDTDRVLLRQTEASYALLDHLDDNRQFLISGGVGSGKTWLALDLARRWVQNHGQRVLLLGYNLAFTTQLRDLVDRLQARRKLLRCSITVLAWEELARDLMNQAGLPYEPPNDGAERTNFFEIELPGYLRQLVVEGFVQASYDALIVDEAQDHDTTGGDTATTGLPGGWWPVYWSLLHCGTAARIGILYDAAQRPTFRRGEFSPTTLLQTSGFAPVRVNLQSTLRYSRPIFAYLKSLESPAVERLTAGLYQMTTLPPGPDVVIKTVAPGEELVVIDKLLRGWFGQGWCRPEQVAILSRRGTLSKSVLAGRTELAGVPLHDGLLGPRGAIAAGSVNRAKGLDRLAVVLVDFEPWEYLEPRDQVNFFIGASRARQLLAAVHAAAVRPGAL